MVALSALLPASGGGNSFGSYLGRGLPVIALLSSQTWVADFTGTVRVHVIGAGGAGQSNDGTGGAAGGYSRKDILVTLGDSFAVTVGAGGLAGGTDGSPSSFVGSGHNLLANGGQGGRAANQGPSAGGTASGGDYNITGGRGAAVTISYGNPTCTGGGAVGLLGVGHDSLGGHPEFITTSGGAGIGGQSFQHGGGSGGPARLFDNTHSTPGPALIGTRVGVFDVANILPSPGHGGRWWPDNMVDGGPGAGGAGVGGERAGHGGAFAGGGAGKWGGHGGYGGGGGGASGSGSRGGFGGDGIVLLEILSVE